ncbi:hypothetical protein C8J57DRAFT_754973 [Mycena rebaudengoi]|nr:hypothetical protein C8J57DRAFT_754973 [Mycena rebaudengoi]
MRQQNDIHSFFQILLCLFSSPPFPTMVRTILALLALGAFHSLFYLVAAQKQETVTLLVPVPMGTDVAGEILGVDDQGRTTYVLKELASDKSAIATATVVEAADHVSFAVNGRTPDFTGAVGFNCALDTTNQNALCLNPAGATATRAAVPPIQGDGDRRGACLDEGGRRRSESASRLDGCGESCWRERIISWRSCWNAFFSSSRPLEDELVFFLKDLEMSNNRVAPGQSFSSLSAVPSGRSRTCGKTGKVNVHGRSM